MTIRIIVLDGPQAGRELAFGDDKESIYIGRDPGGDLVLPPELTMISSRHAVLTRSGRGSYELWDLSRLGTFVDGERVTRRELLDGDVLQLGPDGPRLRVGLDTSRSAPSPSGPGAPSPLVAARVEPRPANVAAPRADARAAPARVSPGARPAWPWIVLAVALLLVGGGVGALVWLRGRQAGPTPAGVAAVSADARPATSTTAGAVTTDARAVATREVSGRVLLPSGVAAAGLRVLAPRAEASPASDGAFRLQVSASPAPPFLALASAAGKPLLVGEAGGELSARSTALALVLLDPEVARRGPAGRAAIRARAEADARLTALTLLVERALRAHPVAPLEGEGSGELYRQASAITHDALKATEPAAPAPSGASPPTSGPASPPGAIRHAARPGSGEGGVEEHQASPPPPSAAAPGGGEPPPIELKDDAGHKTDAVQLINRTFAYYVATITRDGATVPALSSVLLLRNKPYSFLRLAWPPVGRFQTTREVAVGNGQLVVELVKEKQLLAFDLLCTFVGALLGASGMPQLGAEEDLRLLMASVGQATTIVRDFLTLCEKFRSYGTPAEVAKDLVVFFGARATSIVLAFGPLYARTFRDEYVQMLGSVVSKKAIFALTSGYYGGDMLAAVWSLTHQPDRITLKGEQRYGVLPPIELTALTREKRRSEKGRLVAVVGRLVQVPTDLASLELRFSYPGDEGEDRESVTREQIAQQGGKLALARDHLFVKATEAVITAHADDGRLVARASAALGASAQSSSFEYGRADVVERGQITISGEVLEGSLVGKGRHGTFTIEQRLSGRFDAATGQGSGTLTGKEIYSVYGRSFRSLYSGAFEAELSGDTLAIRFTGTITDGSGPHRKGMPIRQAFLARRSAGR